MGSSMRWEVLSAAPPEDSSSDDERSWHISCAATPAQSLRSSLSSLASEALLRHSVTTNNTFKAELTSLFGTTDEGSSFVETNLSCGVDNQAYQHSNEDGLATSPSSSSGPLPHDTTGPGGYTSTNSSESEERPPTQLRMRLSVEEGYQVPSISVDDTSGVSTTFSAAARRTMWRRRRSSTAVSEDSAISVGSSSSALLQNRMRTLVAAFSARAQRIKDRIAQPPTPSTGSSQQGGQVDPPPLRHRLSSLIPKSPEGSSSSLGWWQEGDSAWVKVKKLVVKRCAWRVLEPNSYVYISWLFLTAVCFLYNCWAIPFRRVFPYQTPDNLRVWLCLDYFCDAVYLLDVLYFKHRIKFLSPSGSWISDPKVTRRHYFSMMQFKMDLVSLLPLDLFYLQLGRVDPLLRLPRICKIHTYWEFYDRFDKVAAVPFGVRIVRTVLYMLYMIHLNACAYYGFSTWEGIGSNGWTFDGQGHAYIRCVYFATKTATSIGKNPKPENEPEYVFMTISWLLGVFGFAILLGQIRDIVATAARSQTEYRAVLYQTIGYLERLHVPHDLQDKVKTWFTYTWQQHKTLDENAILNLLPRKLHQDVALSVHVDTLSKVQLFQDCEQGMIRDLVLKLEPVTFLPGDFICKKGEVGKEMYIVKMGILEVVGGPDGSIVLAQLTEGSVFGEISLLAIGGGNRRTADVRSKGFTNLFVLSKTDLYETTKDYPEAQKLLEKKARKLIRLQKERDAANKAKEEAEDDAEANVVIRSRPGTPKLLQAVIKMVGSDSMTSRYVQMGSRLSNDVSSGPSGPASTLSAPDVRSRRSWTQSLQETEEENDQEVLVAEMQEVDKKRTGLDTLRRAFKRDSRRVGPADVPPDQSDIQGGQQLECPVTVHRDMVSPPCTKS